MSDKSSRGRGLGRGLSALMADIDVEAPSEDRRSTTNIRDIPIEHLVANPDQPRKMFDESDLADLTDSIKAKGVLQPLIVRPDPADQGQFQIVAGERRWRAAQTAQLHSLPAIVRDLSDTEILEIGIIENVQRADLNPVEEAAGYRQLIETFGHTQEQLATALGKSRSHIANLMRLLNLPDPLLDHLRHGRISAGHARALLTADSPETLANDVMSQGLSVRETERRAKSRPQSAPQDTAKKPQEKDADTRALETDLSAATGLHVRIDHLDVSGAGQLTLRYRSLDQLDRLCALLAQGLPDESI